MTNLPRRRIEPLDPPPDSFDRVLVGARRRRRRHALAAASSTLVLVLVAAGSFALGSSLNATQRLNEIAGRGTADGPTSGPVAQESRSASKKPRQTQSPVGGTQTYPTKSISWLRGRAVDPDGQGIAGLYVLPGNPGHVTFSSDGAVGARTDKNGNYRIACPRAPVLLATWQLDTQLQAGSTGGLWAATFVGSAKGSTDPVVPACGKTRVKTTLSIGASVHGTVHVRGDCAPGTTFPVWLWLDGDRDETVRLGGLQDGDTFSFAGLPAGTHTLGARRVTVSITFQAGSSVEKDALFTCGNVETPDPPDESPSPTDTPSPSGSASPPATPSPTPSPTVS